MTNKQEYTDPIRSDFRNFLYLVWKHLGLPSPTPVQYEMAHYLQHGPKRLCMEAFRGVGKSWLTSAFAPWCLLIDPYLNILVISASKNRADDFSTFVKRLIVEMPILQHLKPGPDQRSSNVSFDVGPAGASHMPSVKSLGITSTATGSRADIVIADDVESPNNSATQIQRERVELRIAEFGGAILKPGEDSRVIFLGTPQTENSLYNGLAAKGYSIRIWPAEVPEERLVDAYGDCLAPSVVDKIERGVAPGTPIDPDRFGDRELEERKTEYGKAGFALQFQIDTTLADAARYPLVCSDLVVMSCSPKDAPEKVIGGSGPDHVLEDLECVGMGKDRYYGPAAIQGKWLPYEGSVLAIDPSGRGKDETAAVILKQLNGVLYLLEVRGFLGGYNDNTMRKLADMARRHSVNHCVIEANFGDGMFSQLIAPWFQRVHPVKIDEIKHTTQKEKRIIDTLEPVLTQRLLVVDPKVVEADRERRPDLSEQEDRSYQLFHQLTRITTDKGCLAHDDRLDCLAMGVAYWTKMMGIEHETALKERKAERADQEIDDFLESYGGGSLSQPNWVSHW